MRVGEGEDPNEARGRVWEVGERQGELAVHGEHSPYETAKEVCRLHVGDERH